MREKTGIIGGRVVIVFLVLIASAALVVAAIQWQRNIPGTVTVTGTEFEIYDVNDSIMTSFSLGSPVRGTSGTLRFYIENIGDYDAYSYAYFNGSDIMDFSLVQVDLSTGSVIGPLNETQIPISQKLGFELQYTVHADAPRGDFALELIIYASDLATGGP